MSKRNRKRPYKGSKRASVTKSFGLFRSRPLSVDYSRSVSIKNKKLRQLYETKEMVAGSRPVQNYKRARERYETIRSPLSSGFALLKEKV